VGRRINVPHLEHTKIRNENTGHRLPIALETNEGAEVHSGYEVYQFVLESTHETV